jgi:hypothetical protein
MTRYMLTAGKLLDKLYVLEKRRGELPLTLVSTAQRFTALAQALKRVRPVGCNLRRRRSARVVWAYRAYFTRSTD